MITDRSTHKIQPGKPQISVRLEGDAANNSEFTFSQTFRIGRDPNSDVQILDSTVSRNHAEVFLDNGCWWIRDLNSTNGTYINEEKIECASLKHQTTARLGKNKIKVVLVPEDTDFEESNGAGNNSSVTQYVQHYFGGDKQGDAGEHTIMIRRAFEVVRASQKRKYATIIAVVTLLLVVTGVYAFYLHLEAGKRKAAAESMFYAMKSLELELAGIDRVIMDSKSTEAIEVIKKYRNRRKEMEKGYDDFLGKLGIYNPKMTEEERLILRVARIFGECEVGMPPDFVSEVKSYIAKWRSTERLAKAIRMAQSKGYPAKISEAMLGQDLPPQFFYLALQESGFDVYSVGPETYKGFAKGMWQFIPETAMRYGLQVGPLVDLRRPDPADDRHNFEKATNAAARYLKFIYSTDAQASGLLVMASYNWGEQRVIRLLRTMPANPKDRNFWQLLTRYREQIPQETYDYVFYVFSAAVVGENPRLFGFSFENPLAQSDRRT